MIKRIISGGQIGADIAGLRAAKRLGLETGGWMPLGFKTLHGNRPEYEEEFNVEHTDTPYYPARTFLNVSDADATVRFATTFNSYGEQATLRAIRKYNKPYMDVPLVYVEKVYIPQLFPAAFGDWAVQYEVLNVTGNANTAIEQVVEDFIYEALSEIHQV